MSLDPKVALTIRLDHWASILRNPCELDDDDHMELSTLLTEAANAIAHRDSDAP